MARSSSINREAVVIDVCETAEYANGHVVRAPKNIPLGQLETRLATVVKTRPPR